MKEEGPIKDLLTHPSSFLLHPSDGDRPLVLVADDNADMRQYLVRLLAERYEVRAAADGEAALAAARERPPDLVLTDVMMPRLDGFGLLCELRADPRTRNAPVIMLSARAGEESRVEGMGAGADDYLVKPFSARELLARVGAHLQMARMRREAEAQVRRDRERRLAAMAASDTGTFLWNPFTGEFLEFDGNLKRLFGFAPDEPVRVTEDFINRVHSDDMAKLVPALDACRRGADFEMEHRVILPTGETRWLYGRAKMQRNAEGVPTYLVGACTDITDRKRAEEALQEADRRKDEFLATLAHELRNPLTPLRNGLQIMRLAGHSREAVEQARTMMERQLGQMVRLIDDLLDLSRIGRGKIELRTERVELAKVIQQAVETSRPLIEAGGHDLTIDVPPQPVYVDADVTRLAQVFANLLNNAAKFTDRGGRITLAVGRQGGDVVVSVKDTGVGIPTHLLPKVFELFMQVDRRPEKSQGGLGVGLSLVKRLVEMHGGSVEARSGGHGMGSEFVVRLPVVLALAGPGPGEGAGAGAAATARRRILVVDDNRDAAVSLAMMLRVMGNETQTAHDGLEALDVAAAFRPDVILLDIGMPRLNGRDAARRIRRAAWGKHVVLAAVTGWGQEEDRRQSREAGFDLHLVKPVDPAALEKLLAGLRATTG
jgi:PAS domain S-box-containing protein